MFTLSSLFLRTRHLDHLHIAYSPRTATLDPNLQQLGAEKRAAKREQYPLIDVSPEDQFRHVLYNFTFQVLAGERHRDSMARPIAQAVAAVPKIEVTITKTGLRKISPYWYNYTTMAKGRWLGREILEVVSTEFRDRSMEYYVRLTFNCSLNPLLTGLFEGQRYALDSGVTTVNGGVAKPDTIIRNGDRIECVCYLYSSGFSAYRVI